jgi:tetratricopeptide (TPR) repeat protein
VKMLRASSARAAACGLAIGMAALLAAPTAHAQTPQALSQINQALQAGEADRALGILSSLPGGGSNSADALNLECRVRYILQQWDTAVQRCEQAVALNGQNAAYHLWLARALGEKADRASFMTAFSLAKRVRSEFEAAVQLSPRNVEMLASLGDFYQQAPGIVGGGLDKAEGIVARLDAVDQGRAHLLRSRIAESRKDYVTEEQELKQAIASSAHPADIWTNLASFYRKRERWQDIDGAIKGCVAAVARDRQSAYALYDGAGVLIESHRDPTTAAKLLEDYLASSFKTEEAPAIEAHVRLAKMKKQLGDITTAQREKAAALQLAHDYKPALDLKL